MGRKETKKEIEQLKEQLKADNKNSDFRLLKLTFVLVILAIIAAFLQGRIQLW
jgi:hypothetical protein